MNISQQPLIGVVAVIFEIGIEIAIEIEIQGFEFNLIAFDPDFDPDFDLDFFRLFSNAVTLGAG